MRVSDAERQRVIDELRRHCAAGRLDVDEYATRIEKALEASTLEELDRLRADLPMMRIADPVSGRNGRTQPGAGPGRLAAIARRGADEDPSAVSRVRAFAVALLSVVVVFGVIVLSLAVQWTWAVVLLVGWCIGLLQGWLGRRTGPLESR